MDNIEREQIKKKNEDIRRAILVSQMQDHPGFAVFTEDLKEVEKNYQFQDVRFVKTVDDLNFAKGYVQAIEDLINYCEGQKRWAIKPMVDENTGEEEILNNNKEE